MIIQLLHQTLPVHGRFPNLTHHGARERCAFHARKGGCCCNLIKVNEWDNGWPGAADWRCQENCGKAELALWSRKSPKRRSAWTQTSKWHCLSVKLFKGFQRPSIKYIFSNQVYLLIFALECLSMIVKLTVKILKTDSPWLFLYRCYFVW